MSPFMPRYDMLILFTFCIEFNGFSVLFIGCISLYIIVIIVGTEMLMEMAIASFKYYTYII